MTGSSGSAEVVQHDLPGMPFFRDSPGGASGMALRAASEVFSRWFLAMRSAVSREKFRRADYREENGLRKKARVPAMPSVPTEAEECVASTSESVIRAMFGDAVADYARDSFLRAMRTSDMRAFKIRLLMLRARDSLRGPMHDDFSRHVNAYIEYAEKCAGCKPSPGPHRMSKAERERKRRKEKAGKAYDISLFAQDDAATPSKPDPEPTQVHSSENREEKGLVQDIDTNERKKSIAKKPTRRVSGKDGKATLSTPVREGCPLFCRIISSISEVLVDNTIERIANKTKNDESSDFAEETNIDADITDEANNCTAGITVISATRPESQKENITVISGVTVTETGDNFGVVRKVRRYTKTSEIIEDVRDGKIVPYESASEVVSDMKRGVLSPLEAMLFISAMDKLTSPAKKRRGGKRGKKMEILEVEDIGDEEGYQEVDDSEDQTGEDECGAESGFARLGDMVDETEEW